MMTSFYLEKWLNNSLWQDRSEIGHGNQKRDKSCKILAIRNVACLTLLKSECTSKFQKRFSLRPEHEWLQKDAGPECNSELKNQIAVLSIY